MALKAVHVTDIPSLDQITDTQTLLLHPKGVVALKAAGGFMVVGHRGKGMNALTLSDQRLTAVKENSLLPFNQVGPFPIDVIEFDIRVTKDDIPIIFHDNYILAEEAVVFEHANERPIIFTSFQPDAAQLMRKLQSIFPVGSNARRNSLDEAIKLCLASGLQGIVSEAKGIFKNPSAVHRIKESSLALLTYGQLNNVPEAVYMQHLMGINGVIVDLVEEITVAVSDVFRPATGRDEILRESSVLEEEKGVIVECARPGFSGRELSFLLRLILELVEH